MLKIKPVNTKLSTYDMIDIQTTEVPFVGNVIKSVTLYDSNDIAGLEPDELFDFGTQINTFFTSLPEGKFAFNPGSYCEKVMPQLEDQDLIKKSDIQDLHSGMNSYPVYELAGKLTEEIK